MLPTGHVPSTSPSMPGWPSWVRGKRGLRCYDYYLRLQLRGWRPCWKAGLAGALRGALRPAPGQNQRPAPPAPEPPRSSLGVTIPESPVRPILLRPDPRTGLACSRISFRRRAPRACSITCLRALRLRAYARRACALRSAGKQCCTRRRAAGS